MQTKKYTLPKEFGEKWVAALRSMPESQHIQGQLKEGNCYCAIGCSLFANNYKISRSGMSLIINGKTKSYYREFIFNEEFVEDIVNLNDNMKKTFSEIADWIEQNVNFI